MLLLALLTLNPSAPAYIIPPRRELSPASLDLTHYATNRSLMPLATFLHMSHIATDLPTGNLFEA
jgi:hypothetical protein